MRNNAWVALAIVLGILALSMMLHVIFITVTTPDGEVIEGNLFRLEEGSNITITGNDATNTITISATGSAATGIDVELNGMVEVADTQVLDFLTPFNVGDDGGDAQISLPLADDSVFVGDASSVPVATAWPNCDLNFQATTYSTGSNAIGCQFIANTRITSDFGLGNTWTIPGWACEQNSTAIGFSQNDLVYGLIVPPQTTTYTAIGINVSSAGAGGTIARLGIYDSELSADGYAPGDLIVDAGTVSIASTGDKTIAISETLEGGHVYFTTIVHDAAAVSVLLCTDTLAVNGPATSRGASLGADIRLVSGIFNNVGTGALADPATTPDTSISAALNTIVKLSE